MLSQFLVLQIQINITVHVYNTDKQNPIDSNMPYITLNSTGKVIIDKQIG